MTCLEDLKENAIAIHNSIQIVYFGLNSPSIFVPFDCTEGYNITNKIVGLYTENTLYVIPYSPSVMKIIEKNSFKKVNMYIPFTHDDYPLYEKEKWERLVKSAKKEIKTDFTKKCINYSNQKGYLPINKFLLSNCLQIPENGIKVTHPFYNITIKEELTYENFDLNYNEKLGHFSIKNDVCIFIYRNGKTYITKSKIIQKTLKEAGYIEGNLFVPLINNEQILDERLQKKWNKICQIYEKTNPEN